MEANMVSSADVVRTCSREAQTTSSHDIARARRETHNIVTTKPPNPPGHLWVCLHGLALKRKYVRLKLVCMSFLNMEQTGENISQWPHKLMQFFAIAVEFVLNYVFW